MASLNDTTSWLEFFHSQEIMAVILMRSSSGRQQPAGILSRLAESYTARCNWQQRLCRSFITATHDSSRINLGLVGLNDPAKNPKKTRTCYWRPMPQGSEIPAASLCVVPTVCMCQCVYACILKHNKRNLSPKRTGCQWGDMPTVLRLPVRL